MAVHNTGYTSCGYQGNLQVLFSQAKAVTVDREAVTKSRTLHTLSVRHKAKKTRYTIDKLNNYGKDKGYI